jgi:hypothetical protein
MVWDADGNVSTSTGTTKRYAIQKKNEAENVNLHVCAFLTTVYSK